MPNKFEVLSEMTDKKRQITITEGVAPRKGKDSKPKEDKPKPAPKAAAKPAAKQAKKGPPAPVNDAPLSLKDAQALNRKRAEEQAAKKAAEAAAKAEAEQAAAAAAAEAAAAAAAAAAEKAEGDAATEGEEKPAADSSKAAEPAKPAPAVQVKTLADIERERRENQFVIGTRQVRSVDSAAYTKMQKMDGKEDELVIKKEAKPAAKAPAKGKGAKVAPAPQKNAPKETKSEKVNLQAFADFSKTSGRGGYRGEGRGGYHAEGGFRGGRGGNRGPRLTDKNAFPTLV